MQAENNNDIAITEAKLKDFLSSVLSSEGIVVDIRRTFIEYNGVNRSRVFARHANRMACKGSNEKFVVIALLCYPALQWLLKAQDIDALIEKLKEENEDESVWRMSNIQRILESSMGGCKPQLRLEMRKLFFARCQQLVDEIDEAMNKAVFMNPASKPSRISLAMAMLRGSILDSDPVTAVTIRNNFDSIVEDVTAIAGDAIKPLVMQLAPNEGEAKTAEAAYLYHNTEVLLREYSRIVNPSVADENRSLRILAQGGNTLESDARCHQAQVLVQYAQLIRGAIELVKDFPGDSKLYDVLMVADSYTGAAQYAEEQTDESFTVSGMRFAGNGQELVVVGTRSAGDDEGNAAVRTAVADMLEKAVPAQGSGNITLNGVAVTTDGCEASFSNGLALVKNGDGEVKFTPSSYDSETIAFDDAGTTASGAAVTHSDYANVNDTEAYLIESDEGNVMAFTNNADLLTSVLGLQ